MIRRKHGRTHYSTVQCILEFKPRCRYNACTHITRLRDRYRVKRRVTQEVVANRETCSNPVDYELIIKLVANWDGSGEERDSKIPGGNKSMAEQIIDHNLIQLQRAHIGQKRGGKQAGGRAGSERDCNDDHHHAV